MENHESLMKDSSASSMGAVTGNIITTVTPERKAEEEKAEQEEGESNSVETPEPVASTPLRHDTKVNRRLVTWTLESSRVTSKKFVYFIFLRRSFCTCDFNLFLLLFF